MLYFLVALLGSLNLFSQRLEYNLNHYTRYDQRNFLNESKDRVQIRQKYKIYFSLTDKLKLKTVVASGGQFTSEWNTIDFKKWPKYEVSLRNLYGDYNIGNVSVQFGSIPTFKNYKSPLNLDKNGWIDQGVRGEYRSGETVFEVVGGRVASTNNAWGANRFGAFNYAEVEISTIINKSLILEAGYEYLDESFLKAEIRKKVNNFSKHFLLMTFQGLFNLDNNSHALGLEVEFKGRQTKENILSQFSLLSRLIYTSKNLGERGAIMDEFSIPGTVLMTELKYSFKGKKAELFFNNSMNLNSNKTDDFHTRFNIGAKYQISGK